MPTIAELDLRLRQTEDRLRAALERIARFELSPSADHGNLSHTPDFLAEGGYTRGDLVAANASGVLVSRALGAIGRLLRSDGSDPVYGSEVIVDPGDRIRLKNRLSLDLHEELTIAGGLITPTRSAVYLTAESGGVDDLVGIVSTAASPVGDTILLSIHGSTTITIKHNNIGAAGGQRFFMPSG